MATSKFPTDRLKRISLSDNDILEAGNVLFKRDPVSGRVTLLVGEARFADGFVFDERLFVGSFQDAGRDFDLCVERCEILGRELLLGLFRERGRVDEASGTFVLDDVGRDDGDDDGEGYDR